VTTAWNYAITKFGVKADKAILWGGSMGSLTMLNYLKANPANVAACGMALPIVDPEDVRVNNRGGFQAAIEAVYGAATPVPNSNRPNQNVGSFGSVPVAMWGSDDDTVGQSNLATAFATAIGAQYTSFGAHGHAYEAFVDVKQVLTFLNQFK
jgi:predicted alpha/beta hydrolase family esterase